MAEARRAGRGGQGRALGDGRRRAAPGGRVFSAMACLAVAGLAGPLVQESGAQLPTPPPPDSAAVAQLEALVVTADRARTAVGSSVAAVTRLDARRSLGTGLGLGELLRFVPGFSLVALDGNGLDPQPMVRGFYGGGEASYVAVLLDGRPLHDLQSGMMTWDLVAPVAIQAVEVVRGSSSALYGDAAVAGVVNLVSSATADRSASAELVTGADGLLRGGARVSTGLGERSFGAFVSGLRTDGSRAHSGREHGTLGVSVALRPEGEERLVATARSTWRRAELPGPLPESAMAVDRGASLAFYRFDESTERVHSLSLDGSTTLGSGPALSGTLTSELRRSSSTRTLPLAVDFADTKERELSTDRLSASAQVEWEGAEPEAARRLVVGVDASTGRIDSEHFTVVSGPESVYAASSGGRGPSDAAGGGRRHALAGFAQLELRPHAAVRVAAGARYDVLWDRFEPLRPSAGGPTDARHTALSPKAGVNVRWIDTDATTGTLYLSASRSFKAPTPDQLFDQRSFPLPFPPFSATTSNAELVPQHGTSVEVGAYQSVGRVGPVAGALTLAVYRMDMRDELDFDVAALRYVNIGESRHQGVEGGLSIYGPAGSDFTLGYALQDAKATAGANAGRALKAVPRHTLTASAGGSVVPRVWSGLVATRATGAWLDDESTVRQPGWTRVDARAVVSLGRASVHLEVRNLLDRAYSSTGFLDPGGSGTVFHYPAVPRTLTVGVTMGR